MAKAHLFLGLVMTTLLMGSCAGVASVGRSSCRFAYTDEVRDTLVVPELQRALGEQWKTWKVEDPTVFEGRSVVHLLVHLRDEMNFVDPPDYEFVVDSCGKKLIRAGKCYYPGTGAPVCGGVR
jgi:hypothetical protein